MKRFLIVAMAGVMLFGGASTASAVTLSDLQAQINEAWQQIQSLRVQLNERQTTPPPVDNTPPPGAMQDSMAPGRVDKPRICALLNRDLAQGTRGSDVSGLQEYLKTEGFLKEEATGYFGPVTQDAVQKWQVHHNIVRSGAASSTGAGRLGPASRERLLRLCEGNTGGWQNPERFSAEPLRGGAPLEVTFKTWISGFRVPNVTYSIDFGDGESMTPENCLAPADACIEPGKNMHTYTADGTYTATLNKITDPCHGQVACRAAIMREVVGTVQIRVGSDATQACTAVYKPVCGSKPIVCVTTPCNPIEQTYSNRCAMEADGATFLYDGQCRPATTGGSNPGENPQCKSWRDTCGNICARATVGGPAACTLMACRVGAEQKAMCTSYFGTGASEGTSSGGSSNTSSESGY